MSRHNSTKQNREQSRRSRKRKHRNYNNNNKFTPEIIDRYNLSKEITEGVKIHTIDEDRNKYGKDINCLGMEICRSRIGEGHLRELSNKILDNEIPNDLGFFVYARNILLGFVYYSKKKEILKNKIRPSINKDLIPMKLSVEDKQNERERYMIEKNQKNNNMTLPQESPPKRRRFNKKQTNKRKILYIDLICTRKNKGFKGFRLGKILLDYVVDDAISKNIPFIELNSVPSAEKFYRKYGFSRSRSSSVYTDNNNNEDVDISTSSLPPPIQQPEINLNSYSVNPNPYSVNPNPYSVNPNPYSVNPNPYGGGKKIRKHSGIHQTGGKAGKLKKGYKYSGKKLKNGKAEIKKVKSKKVKRKKKK